MKGYKKNKKKNEGYSWRPAGDAEVAGVGTYNKKEPKENMEKL